MAQDKQQDSGQQRGRGIKGHAPTSQDSEGVVSQPKKDTVDLASINASAVDESGEFVREGKKDEHKKSTTKQEVRTKSTSAEKSQKKNKEYIVPVLRTYQQDTKSMAQTKGGAELRTILAKEAEEKRQAQVEYRRRTKDIMKDSAVLQDRYNNFVKGRQGQGAETSEQGVATNGDDIKDIDQKNITRVLSGATAYMQSAGDTAKTQEKEPPIQPTKSTITPPKEESPKPATPSEVPDRAVPSSTEKSDSQATEKKGIFARVRGRVLPQDVFTEEKRESLKQKQQEVIEKEEIQDAWKDFKQKKEKLQEMGMRARDVRSYATSPEESIPNKPLRRQNILLLAIVFFLLAGLISSIIFLAITPAEKPIVDSSTANTPLVSDVLSSENKVFVDTADAIILSDTWQSITEKGGEQNTVTKYVPYRLVEEERIQISFEDFSDTFNIRFPSGLQNAFDEYYFVGKYLTQAEASGVFIASVKKYGDAFVWIRNWEKSAANAFSEVFPNFLERSRESDVTVESRIIDNQDVRVVQSPASQKEIFYYFFGRSVLVFIIGEESVIPLINARIRSTNAL